MRKAGFVLAPVWLGALLLAVGAPAGAAWPAPETEMPAPEALSIPSRADWYRSLIQKGHASERLGQRQDALADYTLAIESHALMGNDQIEVLSDRARLREGMGRPKDALADYGTVLSLSPNFVAALNGRAVIYARQGQFADACHDYLSALAVVGSSERQHSYFGLGQVSEAQGDVAQAREFYNLALAADPHFGPAGERLSALIANRENVPSDLAAGDPSDFPSGGRKTLLQLGAWRSEQKAARGWDHVKALASNILQGVAPRIVPVNLPRAGRFL